MSRYYFEVEYDQREVAKAIGAYWDNDVKSWYAADVATQNVLRLHGFRESLEVCDKVKKMRDDKKKPVSKRSHVNIQSKLSFVTKKKVKCAQEKKTKEKHQEEK